MGKFDITAAFQAAVGNVSKSDTNRETIEYIGLDLIDDDTQARHPEHEPAIQADFHRRRSADDER